MSWEVTISADLGGVIRQQHSQIYDAEPTAEQITEQTQEAKKVFTREATRLGVVVDDPGTTPSAQPVDDGGPGARRRLR